MAPPADASLLSFFCRFARCCGRARPLTSGTMKCKCLTWWWATSGWVSTTSGPSATRWAGSRRTISAAPWCGPWTWTISPAPFVATTSRIRWLEPWGINRARRTPPAGWKVSWYNNDVALLSLSLHREELRGIPRPGKDVDWTKEVPTLSLTATTLPPPIQISLSDILNKVSTKKPQLILPTLPTSPAVNGTKLLRTKRRNAPVTEFSTHFSHFSPTGSNAKTVCYYSSWSASRPGLGRFSPEDVSAEVNVSSEKIAQFSFQLK